MCVREEYMKNDKKKKLMAVLLAGSLLFSGATHAAAGEFSEYPEGMETDGGSDFDFGPDDFSEDPIPETEAYEAVREIQEDASESLPDSEQPGEAASAPTAYIEENVEAAEEETEKKEENGSDFNGDTGNTDEESNIRYVKGRPLTEAEIAQERALEVLTPGMIMPDEIEEENTRRDSFLLAYASELPEKYDAREKGLVTPVKNQNQGTSLGICWAFSMASLMETSLLMQGLGTYDLSEEHLAYFLYNRVNDPLGNTPNDHTYR